MSNEVGTGYNDEPNNINNNILNDDRNMYVWSVGSLLTKSPSTQTPVRTRVTLESPAFRMNESGRRLLAYANYVDQPGTLELNNNGTSVTALDYQIEDTINRYTYVTVVADTNLNSGYENQNWYVGTTTTTSNIVAYYNLHTRRYTSQGSGTNAQNNGSGGSYKSRIKSIRLFNDASATSGASTTGNNSERIKMPKVHSRSTGTDTSMIVMSYGDSLKDNDIMLHY